VKRSKKKRPSESFAQAFFCFMSNSAPDTDD